MTALCGGGTSGVRGGSPTTIFVGAGLITEGLGVISPWLLPLAIYFDALTYNTVSNCATDPPAMPTASQLSPINAIGGILNPNFQAWLTAANNLLLNWLWSVYCQCTSPPQPSFTFPPPPQGVGLPGQSGGSPCLAASYSGPVIQFQNATGHQNSLPSLDWPGTLATFTTDLGVVQTNARVMQTPVPTSVSMSGTITFSGTTPNACNTEALVGFYNQAGHGLTSPFTNIINTSGDGVYGFSFSGPVPATAYYLTVSVDEVVTAQCPLPNCDVQIQWNCGTTPAGGCCTDPAVLELLQNLLSLSEAIYQALPILPNSYAESTVHSGLTGNGTLTIAAATIAIKVAITTDLPAGRIDLGSPNYLFDRGYIVPIAAEGPIRGITRLVYNPQLYVLPHLTDQIGYSIPTGEVVSITELTRGP